MGHDHPGQCSGNGKLREADQQKDRRPARFRVAGTCPDIQRRPGQTHVHRRTEGLGSYLSPEIDPIGDVDIELTYGRRITDQRALSDYIRASGRSFNTYLDQLLWPQTELALHLKKRSAFIGITIEDITRITNRFETIYSIDADTQAVLQPAGRSLIGR